MWRVWGPSGWIGGRGVDDGAGGRRVLGRWASWLRSLLQVPTNCKARSGGPRGEYLVNIDLGRGTAQKRVRGATHRTKPLHRRF